MRGGEDGGMRGAGREEQRFPVAGSISEGSDVVRQRAAPGGRV